MSRTRCRRPLRRNPIGLERLEERVTPSLLGVFELDANVTTGVLGSAGSTTTSHDWDQVHANTAGGLASTFVADKVNSNADDIFTGGGSKDTLGIQQGSWLFTDSKPQAKDDITQAFAAAYTDPTNGHLVLYAGLTRYDNSGAATAGFWFFKNAVDENPGVTRNGGHPFIGTHTDGDILLVSDFTIGGSVSTIRVFRWTGNDSTGSLVPLNNGNPIGGSTFAIVNSAPVGVPWAFQDKSGNARPAAGEFLEEGVDLTALGLEGCFSGFLAETRSSQSPTATLSDFTRGTFQLCSLAATPFTGLSKVTDAVTYPLTVTNTGGMPLYIQSVSDTLLGNIVVNGVLRQPGAAGVNPFVTAISSTYNFSQPLAPGASLTVFVTRTVQASDPDPTVDTVTFVGNDEPDFNADEQVTASATNTVNLFQPSARLTLTASPTAAVAGTPITYTYTVMNTSSADSPNLVLDTSNANNFFTDSLLGNLEADAIHAAAGSSTATTASIVPGATFSFTKTRAIQASDPSPLTNTASAGFTLVQSAAFHGSNVIRASASATVRIVNARINIAPSATNEVGQPHTFTVTVLQDDGLPAGGAGGDGVTGFGPAAGANVTATLTNANGAVAVASTPLAGTTNTSGQFQVTFTSGTAGQVIGNARATLSVSGVSLTRATGDGVAGDSGPATKTFVDARISIAPSATNGITEPHTFTVTVLRNDGLPAGAPGGDAVTGFGPATGANATVTLTNANGAVAVASTPLSGTTNTNGQFLVTFTSNTAGQIVGNARATLTVGGVSLTRATGDGRSGDSGAATKTFVAGSLRWKKVDEQGNLLGGATFQVTATGGTAAAAGHMPLSVSVLDNGPLDADPTPGLILLKKYQSFGGAALGGLALGTYTVKETIPPTNYTLDPKTLTATLTLSAPNADLSGTPFVNTLPKLAIVKTVTAGQTVIHPGDTASFTITVSNTGVGTANNVVLTDHLPDADVLHWTVTASTGFATATVSTAGVLTASSLTLLGGASDTVVVSAVIPLDFFGSGGAGAGNGNPLPLGLFELDGNTTTGVLGSSGSTTTSHDWDQIYNDVNNGTITSGAIASSFVTDQVNSSADDIFTGGGSKDTRGIQGNTWLFTDSKPQAKDDIMHAYAGDYIAPNGDQILVAGLDRYDNSGAATAGFWFFVNPIGEDPTVTQNGGHPFTGTHHDGDILLVSDFTVGGSVSTIRVFRWTGDDSTGSLVPLNNGNPIGGTTFAIVNSAPVSVPWAFQDKSRNARPAAGEFLEQGINLTALGLQGCFSTFLAETRSSPSPTATLSDFVFGSFNTCMATLPNTASVRADNHAPLTSNEVTITVNDGDEFEATFIGSGPLTGSITLAQVQSALAQGIDAWRAAGVSPSQLSNLANLTVHVDNLPGAELGYSIAGAIWIDPTAAGWGWSTDGAGGRMDLNTVVTHELGHALGFKHQAVGVMETTLAPGTRLLPETANSATTNTPTRTAATVTVADVAHPTAFAASTAGVVTPSVSVQGGADAVRRIALPAPMTTSAAPVLTTSDRDTPGILVPAIPDRGAAGGTGEAGPSDEPAHRDAATRPNGNADAQARWLPWWQECDDETPGAIEADCLVPALATDSAGAAAALVLVLGGFRDAVRHHQEVGGVVDGLQIPLRQVRHQHDPAAVSLHHYVMVLVAGAHQTRM